MNGMVGIRVLIMRLAGLRAGARPGAFHRTPESERLRSALEMHDLGVKLYRQRMRREHPDADRREIESLVRTWLAAPSPDTRLRLPSREHRGYAG
jgi:Rv0078B-related antitoxin